MTITENDARRRERNAFYEGAKWQWRHESANRFDSASIATRSCNLFPALDPVPSDTKPCPSCGAAILGEKYGEGRAYDGPGVPHVCKPWSAEHAAACRDRDCKRCYDVREAVTPGIHANAPKIDNELGHTVTPIGIIPKPATKADTDTLRADLQTLARAVQSLLIKQGWEVSAAELIRMADRDTSEVD